LLYVEGERRESDERAHTECKQMPASNERATREHASTHKGVNGKMQTYTDKQVDGSREKKRHYGTCDREGKGQ
jgi:hypothetical protein